MRERRKTTTSNFGVGARESHDATAFYDRFRAPELSDDQDVLDPVRERVRSLAREQGIADRRRRPIQPPAEPEQLALAGFLAPEALRRAPSGTRSA